MSEISQNNIKVTTFHTSDLFYSSMVKKLEESCNKFSISFYAEKIDSRGSWVSNCAYKCEFLLKKLMEENENDCIIWLDADSQVMEFPRMFFETKNDFGIRCEPGGRTKKPAKRETISIPSSWPSGVSTCWFNSGTIFLRNVESVRSMIREWVSLQSGTNKWDQWTLQEAWSRIQPRTEWLSKEYCQIKKLHKEKGAIILHDLASVIQKVNRT